MNIAFIIISILLIIVGIGYISVLILKQSRKDSSLWPQWFNQAEVREPFFIPLIIALIGLLITFQVSEQSDKILNEINNTTAKTYTETLKISGTIEPLGTGKRIDLKSKIITLKINSSGTFLMKLSLTRQKNNERTGYIFDIGDSYVKNRMSLFVDENGLLSWRIIDKEFTIHTLRTDITSFLDGKPIGLALVWTEAGDMDMTLNGRDVGHIRIEDLEFDIKSQELKFGSDLDGNYQINFGDVPTPVDLKTIKI